jgi:tetratricopeptide (TPR) repeat protein
VRARCASRLVRAALLGALTCLFVHDARAQATVWQKARSPVLAREQAALDVADHELAQELKTEGILQIELPEDVTRLHTLRAIRALEEAGGETSKSPAFIARLAGLLHDAGEYAAAARLDRALVASDAHPAYKADAWADLAIAYARFGRVDDEIAAYESSLAGEPWPRQRAVLLSNQAEAYMVKGDVGRAIDGYRASLGSLSSHEMFGAATTLWSLGVALDRSGDLEGALTSIARARTYDPTDRQLQPPRWFFVPEYDSAWYAALGELLVARTSADPWVQQAAYHQAVDDFREFVERAGDKDLYVAIARARLKLVENEAARLDKKLEHVERPDVPSAITPLPRPH